MTIGDIGNVAMIGVDGNAGRIVVLSLMAKPLNIALTRLSMSKCRSLRRSLILGVEVLQLIPIRPLPGASIILHLFLQRSLSSRNH
jgi:hypothetical protein